MKRSLAIRTLLSVAAAAICMPALGQEPTAAFGAAASESPSAVAEQRYAQFAAQAKGLELAGRGSEKQLTLREQPLQTFSSEGHTFGSVLLWEDEDGRPGVIGTLGSLPIRGTDFGFIELHWLLTEPMKPVTIGKNSPKRWQADGQDVAPKLIADAPTPAEAGPTRLLQMRNLARAFSAGMTHQDNRHQLRLLPQPLYRYENHSKGTDGAIFAFVWTIGTDPEVLLHIQSREQDGQVNWYWQPIRFTWRAVDLSYKEDKVWEAEEFVGRDQRVQTGPYLTTLTEPIP